MKSILKVIIVAACIGCVCVALRQARARAARPQPHVERTKWVESCLRGFEVIKADMTRGEIEGKLPMDGGLQGASPVRFTHPACAYLKLDVAFEFKRNAADQNRAIPGKEDKATKVSRPYPERPFAD